MACRFKSAMRTCVPISATIFPTMVCTSRPRNRPAGSTGSTLYGIGHDEICQSEIAYDIRCRALKMGHQVTSCELPRKEAIVWVR